MSTIIPPSPLSSSLACCVPAVFVGGIRRRDLKVMLWQLLPAPLLGRIEITLAAGRCDPSALPPANALITVTDPATGASFTAVSDGTILRLDDSSETLILQASCSLQPALAACLSSFWQLVAGSPVKVECAKVQFNRSAACLASASSVTLAGRSTRIFSAASDAVRWSAADALAYVLAAACPPGLAAPSLSELESLAGDIDLGRLDITGMTAADALAKISSHAGLAMRLSAGQPAIEFFRPGRTGRLRSVSLQNPPQPLDAAQSNLWKADIALRPVPRTGVLAMGDRKVYESTFTLRPGWDPAKQTTRWRDFCPSLSGNWPALADIFRKWVLNEHGRYSEPPWNLPLPDLSSISGDFKVTSPRRFLPCISAAQSGSSLGIVLQYRTSPTGPWCTWPSAFSVSATECSVHLDGDGLPADYFQAALAATAQVRLTASLQSDARISASAGPTANCRTIAAADHAAWRKVDSSSIFADAEGISREAECDDTALLQRLAQRVFESSPAGSEAELTLAWIDTTFQVGDIVDRVDGRCISLGGSADRRPSISKVVHDFARQTTTLTVTA